MGFFEKIFGKQEEKAITLNISEIDVFLEKQTFSAKQELSGIIASRFAEIKHSLRRIEQAVKQLEQADFSSQNQKLSAIVKTSRQNMAKQLVSLSHRMLPPAGIEAKQAFAYCNESLVFLHREGQFFGKNIAYTSIYLKEEVKGIGEQMKELVATIEALKKNIEERSTIFAAEKILGAKQELLAQKEKKAEAREAVSSLKATIAGLEKQRSALAESISEIQNSKEHAQLSALQEKKAGLQKKKDEVNSEVTLVFSAADKPLRRLASLAKAKKLFLKSPEQESLLESIISNPVSAIKKDPKGESIKEILAEAKSAIEQGTITLKEKEKGKRIGAISALLSANFFDSFFWKMNEAEAALNDVERKLSQEKMFKLLSDKREMLRETERQLEQARIAALQKETEHSRKKELVESMRQKLEATIAESFGKKFSLVID